MGIKKSSIIMIITLLVLTASRISAENQTRSVYGLFLSPENCILLETKKECEIKLEVGWQTLVADDYCLYISLDKTPIICWQNESNNTTKIGILLQADLKLELRKQSNHRLIYSSDLKLYKQVSHLRKKRRNPWSFY